MAWTDRYHDKWPRLTALYHIENEQNSEADTDAPVEGYNNTPVLPPGPGGFYRYYVHPDDIRSSRRSMSAYSMSQQSIDNSQTKKVPCCGICLGTMLIFSFAAIISVSVVLSILWTEPHVVSQTTENGTAPSSITNLELLKSKEKNISKEVCRLMKSALKRNNITSSEKKLHNCSISLTTKKGFMHMVLLLETGNHLLKGDIEVDNGIPKIKIEGQSVTVSETTTKQPISTSTTKQAITTSSLSTTTPMKEPDSVLVLSSEEVKHLRDIFDGTDGSFNAQPVDFGNSVFNNTLLSGLSGNDFDFFSNDLNKITKQETKIEENNNKMAVMQITNSSKGSNTTNTETRNKTSLLDIIPNNQTIHNINNEEDKTSIIPDHSRETTLAPVSDTDKLYQNIREESIQNITEDLLNLGKYEEQRTENKSSKTTSTELPVPSLSETIKTTEVLSSTMYNYGHNISFPTLPFGSHTIHEQPYTDMTPKRDMADDFITTEITPLENVDRANNPTTMKSYSNINEHLDERLKMNTNLTVSASFHTVSENKTYVQELNIISNLTDINDFNETEFINTTFIRTTESKDDPTKSANQNMETNTSVNGIIITNLTDIGKINTTRADGVAKNIQNVYGMKLKIVNAKVTITVVDTLANESIPTGNVSHNRLSPVDNTDTNNTNNTDSNTISSSIASSNKNSTNDTITNIIRSNTTAVINLGKTTPNITKMSPIDTNTTTTYVTNNEDTLLTFTYSGITFVTDPEEYEHIKSEIDTNLEETDVNHEQHQNTTELRNKDNTRISIQAVKTDEVTLMVTNNKSEASTRSNTTNLDDAFNFMSNSTLENNYDELIHVSMENDHTVADISNDTLKQGDNIFGNSSITTFRLNSTDKSNDSFDDHYVSNDRIKTNVTKNKISDIILTSPAIITDIGTTDSNKSTEVNTTSVDDVAMNIKNVYGTKLKIVNARVTITVVDTTANKSKPAGVVSNDGPVEYEDTQNDTKNTNDKESHTISSDFTSSNVTNTNDTITDTFSANTTAVRTQSKTTSNTTNTSSVYTDTTTANLTTSEDNRFENISADLFHISMDNGRIVANISNVTVEQNDDILVNASTISLKINLTDRSKDSFDESSVSNDIMKTNIKYDKMYNTNQTSPPVIEGYQSKVNERLFKLNDVNITTKINENFISTTSSNMTLDTEINREIEKEDTITKASSYINEITYLANPQAYEHIKGVIDSNHIETDETIGSNGTHVTHKNNETNSNTDSIQNFTLDATNFVVETNDTATLLISPGISMTNVTEHEVLPTNVLAESDTKSNSSLSESILPTLMTTMNSLNHTISTLIKLENKTDSLINRTILAYIEKQELDKQNKIDISVNISFPEFSNQTLPPDSQIMDKMFNNMSDFIEQDSYNDAQAKVAHNLNNKTDNLTERSDHDATNKFKSVYGTKLKVLSAETIITVVDASANESIPTDVLANDVLSPIDYEDENTRVINNTTTGVSIPIEIRTENTTLGNVTIGLLRKFEGENITLLRNVSNPDVQIQTGILNDKAEEITNNTLVNNTTVENRTYIKRNATATQYEAANNSLSESLTLESMPAADNNTIHVEKEFSTEKNNTIDVTVSTKQTVKTSSSSLDPNTSNVNTMSLTGNVTDYIEESSNASEIKDQEQITVSNINVHNDTKSMVSVLTSNKTKHMIKSEPAGGTIGNSTVHEIKLLRDTVTSNETVIFTALASNITKENNSSANNNMFHRSVLTDNNTDITETTAVNVTITLQHSKNKINASQLNLTIPRNDSVEDEMKLINNSSFILMSAVFKTVPNNGSIVNMDKTVNFSRDNINGLTNVSLLVNNTVVNLTSSVAISVIVNETRLDDTIFEKRSNTSVPEMSTSFAPTKVDATELTNETKTSETEILYFNPLNATVQNTTHTYAGATKVEQVIDNGTTTTTNTTTTYATVPTFNAEPIISGKNNTTVLHEVNKQSLNNTATSTIQNIKLSKVNQVRISTASPFITNTQPSTVYPSAPATLLPSTTKSDVSAKPTQTSTSFNFPAMSTSSFTVKRSIKTVTKKPMIQNSGLSSKANVIQREDTTASKKDTTTKTTKLQTGGFNSGSNSFFLFDVNLLGQNTFPFSNFGRK